MAGSSGYFYTLQEICVLLNLLPNTFRQIAREYSDIIIPQEQVRKGRTVMGLPSWDFEVLRQIVDLRGKGVAPQDIRARVGRASVRTAAPQPARPEAPEPERPEAPDPVAPVEPPQPRVQRSPATFATVAPKPPWADDPEASPFDGLPSVFENPGARSRPAAGAVSPDAAAASPPFGVAEPPDARPFYESTEPGDTRPTLETGEPSEGEATFEDEELPPVEEPGDVEGPLVTGPPVDNQRESEPLSWDDDLADDLRSAQAAGEAAAALDVRPDRGGPSLALDRAVEANLLAEIVALREQLHKMDDQRREERDKLLTALMRTQHELQSLRYEVGATMSRRQRKQKRGFWAWLFDL